MDFPWLSDMFKQPEPVAIAEAPKSCPVGYTGAESGVCGTTSAPTVSPTNASPNSTSAPTAAPPVPCDFKEGDVAIVSINSGKNCRQYYTYILLHFFLFLLLLSLSMHSSHYLMTLLLRRPRYIHSGRAAFHCGKHRDIRHG